MSPCTAFIAATADVAVASGGSGLLEAVIVMPHPADPTDPADPVDPADPADPVNPTGADLADAGADADAGGRAQEPVATHGALPSSVEAMGAELLQLVLSTPTVQGYLDELAVVAAGVSPAIAGCGITLRRDEHVLTVATSNAYAAAVDEVQYGLGTGPCLQSLQRGEVVEVNDMSTEQRWDGYPHHALTHGALSSLSVPLQVAGITVGALNSYARQPSVFTGQVRQRLLDFTAQAQVSLALVLRAAQQSDVVEQLHAAMQTRSVIDQALGILMGRQRCSAQEAFALLRAASQAHNRKITEIAAELITSTTGHPPAPGRFET